MKKPQRQRQHGQRRQQRAVERRRQVAERRSARGQGRWDYRDPETRVTKATVYTYRGWEMWPQADALLAEVKRRYPRYPLAGHQAFVNMLRGGRTWHIPLWSVGERQDPFADDRADQGVSDA
jgi:hypothetical protein